MRAWLAALLLIAACGAAPGQGNSPLPPPSPPNDALAKWANFPAGAKPRPIIAFGDTVEQIQSGGFPTNDRKIAWMCNKFVLAASVELSDTAPERAIAGGAPYPAISPAQAYSQLMSARSGATSPQCASEQPFVISAVRWAMAGFPTDRGTTQMSAWLFDVPEVHGFIGHAAIDPSAFWGHGLAAGGRGAHVSPDGRTLRVPVENAGPGPCDSEYTASTAESASAVAIAIRATPHSPPAGPVACPAILRLGDLVVTLKAPLGDRVLVDERGNPGMVCPERSDC
jgi:hypothetical protein